MRSSTEVKVTFDFNDFAEALTSTEKESSAKREAYQTLMARNHFLVLTDVIEEQYLEIGRRNRAAVTQFIARVRQECRIARPSRRGGRLPEIQGLPSQHRRLFQEAIRTGSHFLITQWDEWLALSMEIREHYQLSIVTPTEYIRQVSS